MIFMYRIYADTCLTIRSTKIQLENCCSPNYIIHSLASYTVVNFRTICIEVVRATINRSLI